MSLDIVQGFKFNRNNTILHNLDPRAKLVYILSILTLSLIFSELYPMLILFVSTIPLVIIGKAVNEWLRSMKGGFMIILMIFLLNYFLLPAENALSLSTSLTLRFLTIFSAFSIFFMTTYPEDLAVALIKLKIPYDYVLTFTMALRFIPTLAKEAQIIIDAQRSRGLELESGNFIIRIKRFIPILIPLFINSLRRASQIAEAMESRAFGYSDKRSYFHELNFTIYDTLFTLSCIVFTSLGLYIKFYLRYSETLVLARLWP
jgi:energy-coupling factor transport system permease protein